jgi:predicted nucleotide-binding protein (sugar kinase/HSP70/actin superfamily)
MYNAAEFSSRQPVVEFIQLVSFGCGTDAITGDEIRDMLEKRGRFYTQIKIDEISNLGAAKIRLRSLLAAMSETRRVVAASG